MPGVSDKVLIIVAILLLIWYSGFMVQEAARLPCAEAV